MPTPELKSLLDGSNTIVASHAVMRAITERKSLSKQSDLEALVGLSTGENKDAARIALEAVEIIARINGVAFGDLPEEKAQAYVSWLGEFSLKRVAEGRKPDPDLGKTLLLQLRQASV